MKLELKEKLNKKKKRGGEKPTKQKESQPLDTTKTGLFAHFCSQGSCRKGPVWEKLVLRQRLFSLCTQGSLILLLFHGKKKAPKIKVKRFLMQIKNLFIFKKKCRDYSKNKLFWTSPLAHMCSVRWNHWCQSTNSKAGKSRQGQPSSQNFRENLGRAFRLKF